MLSVAFMQRSPDPFCWFSHNVFFLEFQVIPVIQAFFTKLFS